MNKDYLYEYLKSFFDSQENFILKMMSSNLFKSDKYYLVEESWIKKLEENEAIIKNKQKDLLTQITFPDQNPIFINDFSSAINLLKNNKKFRLISKSLIEKIYKDTDLKNNSSVLVYASNDKIILDFQEEKEDKALLIFFKSNELNELIYIIYKNEQLYKNLLNEKEEFEKSCNNYLMPIQKYKNFFYKNVSVDIIYYILEFFFNFYYYNETLLNKKEKTFYESQYYLIDYQWLNEFKNIYSFLGVDEFLKETDNISNNKINYDNIYTYYDILSYTYLFNNKKNLEGVSITFPNNLKNTEKIDIMKNLNSSQKGYIIPSRIFNIINIILFHYENISLNPIGIQLMNNNNFFLYYNNTWHIIIGNLQKEIFIINYILKYNSLNIYRSEKTKLFTLRINDYMNHRKCKNDNSFTQILKDENNQKIGFIYNFKNKDKEEKNNFLNEEEKDEDEEDNNKTIIGKNKKKIPDLDLNKKSISHQDFSKQNRLFPDEFQNKNNSIENNAKNNEINKKIENINAGTNNINNINKNINYLKIINDLKQENEKLKNDYKANLNEIKNLKNKIILMEQNNSVNNEQNNNSNENENEIKKKLDKLNNKEKTLNEIKLDLENKMKLLMKEKEKLNIKKELEKYKIENNKLKNENIILIEKSKKLEKDKKEKEQKYKELFDKNEGINIMNNDIKENKDEKSKQNEILINQPISSYNLSPLIGLNNIGATRFMNATLQCLSQTEYLTNYFLKEENKEQIINNNITLVNKNENQLSPRYLELINNLWSKTAKKSYSPYEFRKIIEEMNPLFKEGQTGDCKDFIKFVLQRIHNELKKPNNNFAITKKNLNQYDKNSVLYNFFYEFLKETSIISNFFFGTIETTNICLNCKNNSMFRGMNTPICYNYQSFNCLIFSLEEIAKMKFNNMSYINMDKNIVNIDDCFKFYEKTVYFINYCGVCNMKCDCECKCKIYVSPIVLILILNKGKDNNYKVKMNFYENINISQYVIENEGNQLIYDLYGVITLIGKSGPSEHFVASCKSPVDQKWYRYSDDLVSLINDFKREVIDFETPYILFYKKKINL